ncbi:MAG TPA: hypothetical protein VH044_00260 [Polyangiaceae bacterium]|jgi:hypothetical protein|nr:hypothetical protein [Polyangiaceae bacterium]
MTASALVALAAAGAAGCNAERKQECDKLLSAMNPVQGDTPSAELVDRVNDGVGALQLQDQPLGVYAKNYRATLTVLSNTLKVQSGAGPDGPPDGTVDVIKQNLKDARTDYDDVSRYCSQ